MKQSEAQIINAAYEEKVNKFEEEKKGINRILPDETFEKKAVEIENQKLTYYTAKSREESSKTYDENLFINLSVIQILKNISRTFIDIMNDVVKDGPRDLVRILGREDRMIYVGIIVLLISFCVYLIDITG